MHDVQKLRHIVDDKHNMLMKMIEEKAEKSDVEDLERRVTDKLNELIKSMIDRFADKRVVAKRLGLIEKQVRVTLTLFIHKD